MSPTPSPTPLLDQTAVHVRTDGVVRVTGPDRLTYLHSLLSQHLEDATPGTVADFLHLDAKGDPLAMGTAVVHAEAVLLVVPREVAADTADRLDRFRFMMQVEVADLTGEWVVASLRGPEPVDAPGARSQPMTAAPHGPGMVVRTADGGVDLLGPESWVVERVRELDLPAADQEDFERWRITAGVPGWGSEVTAGRRTQELGLLPTHVHLRKGCYPGQESIAKIHNLGRPRRALAVVTSDVALEPGTTLGEGRRPGEVTSAADRPEGGSIALALLGLVDGDLPTEVRTADGAPVAVVRRVGEGLPQPGA
ncbi:folate-binding protein YgfZ [Euzebya sp.]|uniref:CAF17-like 4Fe-4S cluster assembly/insertion protein YgfZ n=1 Tax=Euzebya sp. TaxID=1971409 RepID=UPI00351956D9